MNFFDSHCHLQFPQYKDDLDAVLARMRELEMGAVVVGTDLGSSRMGIELAEQHDFLWASVGLHPSDDGAFDEKGFEEIARHPKVVAIGECGLDYFRASGEGQKEKFIQQIKLAEKLNKSLIIHSRNAHDDLLSILQEQKLSIPVVMHFFTASAELAKRYLELGCYLSFPGPVTFVEMYDEAIRTTPMEKLLIETDAPFAAPAPHRGKRNEPPYVVEVARKVAQIKNMSPEEVGELATKNAHRAFGL